MGGESERKEVGCLQWLWKEKKRTKVITTGEMVGHTAMTN